MIIFEVIKYKAWKLATSHSTHSISSRAAEVGVFISLEKNLVTFFGALEGIETAKEMPCTI